MQEGIRRFLEGIGADPDDPNLATTPERVVQAWRDEFLIGYRMDPAAILSDRYPAAHQGPVIITQLRFISVCPHHLLPFSGQAHLAYLPTGGVVGLGRLSSLVDCFARRLVLQETLTHQIPQALIDHLGSTGAACVLVSNQTCMALRGARQEHNRCMTAVYLGDFQTDPNLQALFLKAIPQGE